MFTGRIGRRSLLYVHRTVKYFRANLLPKLQFSMPKIEFHLPKNELTAQSPEGTHFIFGCKEPNRDWIEYLILFFFKHFILISSIVESLHWFIMKCNGTSNREQLIFAWATHSCFSFDIPILNFTTISLGTSSPQIQKADLFRICWGKLAQIDREKNHTFGKYNKYETQFIALLYATHSIYRSDEKVWVPSMQILCGDNISSKLI